MISQIYSYVPIKYFAIWILKKCNIKYKMYIKYKYMNNINMYMSIL